MTMQQETTFLSKGNRWRMAIFLGLLITLCGHTMTGYWLFVTPIYEKFPQFINDLISENGTSFGDLKWGDSVKRVALSFPDLTIVYKSERLEVYTVDKRFFLKAKAVPLFSFKDGRLSMMTLNYIDNTTNRSSSPKEMEDQSLEFILLEFGLKDWVEGAGWKSSEFYRNNDDKMKALKYVADNDMGAYIQYLHKLRIEGDYTKTASGRMWSSRYTLKTLSNDGVLTNSILIEPLTPPTEDS